MSRFGELLSGPSQPLQKPIVEEPVTVPEPIVEEPVTVPEPIVEEPVTVPEPIVEEPVTVPEPIVEEPEEAPEIKNTHNVSYVKSYRKRNTRK
jgi:hypothetical protein